MSPSSSSALKNRDLERLLIVRLSAMGDIIHSLPAATALRQAFPNASIGWVVEERWTELLCAVSTPPSGPRSPQRPLADRIHTVNSAHWRRSPFSTQTWKEIRSSIRDLKAARYQMAIDFQGAVRSALIARWSGTPVVYGAMQPRENAASMFYTRQIATQGAHVVEQNLSLAEVVTQQKLTPPQVELPRDHAAEQECDQRLRERNTRDFVILSPGAGWGAKQWPAERYGQVAKELAKDGLKSLISFAPSEQALMRVVEHASGGAAQGLACSITQLIALTRRARLFIGGDTGPLHLAAALRVPTVAIFGPTDPARNGPFGNSNIVLRSASSITSHKRRKEPETGLLQISPDEVVAAARQLLQVDRG